MVSLVSIETTPKKASPSEKKKKNLVRLELEDFRQHRRRPMITKLYTPVSGPWFWTSISEPGPQFQDLVLFVRRGPKTKIGTWTHGQTDN
jgi:hypothetical protein